jgi:hypothetical protein
MKPWVLFFLVVSCAAQSLLPLLGVGNSGTVTITRVQHSPSSSQACFPTCPITISSTGSGNLGVLAYSDNAFSADHISSVSGGGTWIAAGACVAFESGSGTDLAYVLSLTGGVTSLSITLNGSDGGADFVFFEYSRSSGSWALDGSCGTEAHSAANPNTTASMSVGVGNTDVIVAALATASGYCPGTAVGGTGWTTPILNVTTGTLAAFIDALQVNAGTYQGTVAPQATGQATNCPGTKGAQFWASSALAFR